MYNVKCLICEYDNDVSVKYSLNIDELEILK